MPSYWGKTFINHEPCALILGDNLFYGNGFEHLLRQASTPAAGATVFAYEVGDPHRFGIVEFDASGQALSLAEKPQYPKSHFAVTGLYFYDEHVVQYAKQLTPSSRGELEITDLNKRYLQDGRLRVLTLERGFTWLDTGTHESVLQAANFVHSMQVNQGIEIACLEEIALTNGWLNAQELKVQLMSQPDNTYYNFVRGLVQEK